MNFKVAKMAEPIGHWWGTTSKVAVVAGLLPSENIFFTYPRCFIHTSIFQSQK